MFLLGAERSGTTLLRLMLDGHARIAWLGEMGYAVDFIGDDGSWPAMDDFHERLLRHRQFRSGGLVARRGLDCPALLRSFLDQVKDARPGAAAVGASIHRHFEVLPGIWPEARFVHLVRDPRDVAPSCVAMGWAGNAWTGARGWIEAETEWDRLAARVEPARLHELRFEALLADPRAVLEELCGFIGVGFDPAMLEYPRRSTYGPPDSSASERWRSRLGAGEVRLVEARVGALLAARGYAPSGLPPLDVTEAMRRRLHRQDRLARLRFRLRRYGPALVAAGAVARRLGLRRWERRLERSFQAIDQRHLQ